MVVEARFVPYYTINIISVNKKGKASNEYNDEFFTLNFRNNV